MSVSILNCGAGVNVGARILMAAASFNSLFKRRLASYSAVGLRVVLTVPLVGLFS